MLFDKGYSIAIAGHRCLNRTYCGVECQHCKNLCPSDAVAVTFHQSGIVLDKDKCVGCGLCFSECPVQVFGSSRWDETSIVGKIEEKGWKITEFFCGRHSSPYQDDKNRDRGAIRLPTCLAIVTRGCWYETGMKTEVRLRLDQCRQCPMEKTLPRLKCSIETAAEWLAASGHTPRFNLIHQSNRSRVKVNLKAVDAGLKVTSRRDLFLSLVKEGVRETPDDKLGANTSSSLSSGEGRPGTCLPDWRRRLAPVYSRNMIEGSLPAYWPTITLNSRCVHCGLCVLLCPSGTLHRIVEDGICTYHFTSGFCLDCRICQLICEQKAIERAREQVAKPFEKTCIYTSPVDECRRCGNVTSDFHTRLCYRCRQEVSLDSEFKDVCRKLLIQDDD